MPSISTAIQKTILSLLISKLPIHLDDKDESLISLSSGLHLANLTLDEEKLESQLPKHITFYIRSAKVKQLDVNVSTDGIKANVRGLIAVVSPKMRLSNNSDEVIEDVMKSVIDLVDGITGTGILSKSLEYEYLDDVLDEEESIENDELIKSMIESKTISSDDIDSKGTWTGYVLSYILSKVKVNIKDIKIKFVSDPLILCLSTDVIEVESEKNQRKITIEGVKLGILKSNLETQKKEKSPPGSEELDSDSDYDEMMASSFMAESKDQIQQSLIESVNYKSGTVYMSTNTSGFFDAPSHFTENLAREEDIFELGSLIMYMDQLSFIVTTTSEPLNIKTEIGIINVSMKAFPEFASSLISLLIQLNKSTSMTKSPPKLREHKAETSPKFLVNDFNLSHVTVSLESELNENGQFEKSEYMSLQLRELNIQQKGESFFQGTVMKFEIHESGVSVLKFDNKRNTHVDLKFELQSTGTLRTISVIFSNELQLMLGLHNLKTIMDFYSKLDGVFDKLSLLTSSNPKTAYHTYSLNHRRGVLDAHGMKYRRNEINFRLSGIHGKVLLDEGEISFETSELSYNPINKLFQLGGLKATYKGEDVCKLLDINEITFNNYSDSPTVVKGYDNNTRKEIKLTAKNILQVGLINVSLTSRVASRLIEFAHQVKDIIAMATDDKNKEQLKEKKKVQFEPKRVSRMTSSMMLRTQLLSFFANVKELNFEILDIKPEFGGICGKIRDFGFCQHSEGLSNGYIKRLSVDRYLVFYESIVKHANENDNSPMIFFKSQPGTPSIHFQNFQIDYYGKWLKYFCQNGVEKYEPPLGIDIDIEELVRRKIIKKISWELFVSMNDVVIGLTPVNLSSKALVILKKATCDIVKYNDKTLTSQLTSDSVFLYLIDDCSNIVKGKKRERAWNLCSLFKEQGFVQLGTIDTINAKLNISTVESLLVKQPKNMVSLNEIQMNINDVELRVCSDSLQCLLNLLKDLKQPIYFSFNDKYKPFLNSPIDVFNDIDDEMFKCRAVDVQTNLLEEDQNGNEQMPGSEDELNIVDDYYDKKEYEENVLTEPLIIPLKLYLNVSKVNLLLHDGYDWKETRTQISEAVMRVTNKANKTQNEGEGNEDSIVEETLYQSIYLGMHASDNTGDFVKNINQKIGNQDEPEEIHKKTIELGKCKTKPLKLRRSRDHKVLIEIEDLNVDLLMMTNNEPHMGDKRPPLFANKSENVEQISLGVKRFQIIDNVPTSNWNMFTGYLREAGDIEIGKEMFHLDIDIVRPIASLAAIDLIINVHLLPLRLHIDQDTLDFLLRFGEFQDQRFIPPAIDNDDIYIEKFSINAIQLKLDYKPKSVDYAGIKSGHTGEFMNFFVLDESRMTLNRMTLFGIYGFSKLNTLLNGFWSPDIKRNQLGGVLSGLAFMRSIVNIGQGVEQLVSVPIQDYQRDGRLLQGVQKGIYKFGRTTGSEVLKFGAKLATGTQGFLETTEEMLGGNGPQKVGEFVEEGFRNDRGDDKQFIESDEDESEEEDVKGQYRVVSLYSNQPESFNEGLQFAYGSITKNLNTVKRAIVEASERANQAPTIGAAMGELMRATPVVVIRPLVATTESISKTLMGGVNELDPEEKRRIEEKYK